MTEAIAKRPRARCDECAALCCRLKVVLAPGDLIPAYLVSKERNSPPILRRDADGWCVALDRVTHRCSIHAQRPATCRRFVMGGGYCRSVRA